MLMIWYIEHPFHGVLNPLPIVYGASYPCYFEPPIHGISNLLSMIYRSPYPWYCEPPSRGILTPLAVVYYPLPMVYRTLYTW